MFKRIDSYSPSEPAGHSQQVFGNELAERVAEILLAGKVLAHHHRDYCGMGLDYAGGLFRYGDVRDDGQVQPLRTFHNRSEFAQWLSQQSDNSLARLEKSDSWYWNNQTITRWRLISFVEKHKSAQ